MSVWVRKVLCSQEGPELGARDQEWVKEGATSQGTLTCIHARRGDEFVQLTPQEVPFLFQIFDAFLQPGVPLQGHVQLSPDTVHQGYCWGRSLWRL